MLLRCQDGRIVDELLHFLFTASGGKDRSRWRCGGRSRNGRPFLGLRCGNGLSRKRIDKSNWFHETSPLSVRISDLSIMNKPQGNAADTTRSTVT